MHPLADQLNNTKNGKKIMSYFVAYQSMQLMFSTALLFPLTCFKLRFNCAGKGSSHGLRKVCDFISKNFPYRQLRKTTYFVFL